MLAILNAWLTICAMLLLMSVVLLVGMLAYSLLCPGYLLRELAKRGRDLVYRLTKKRRNV
jgi:polyferredoxin